MAAGDLCALADVAGYLPGYSSVAAIDAKLSDLISAQSTEITERTGREFVPISPTLNPRTFYMDTNSINGRKLEIGDASAVASVVQSRQGTTLQTYTVGTDVVLLPTVRQAWEPYTDIWFPWLSNTPGVFFIEDAITVNATWGYPSVPADVKQACAKLVVIRYLTDVAKEGTAFADAVTGDINIGGMFASAEAVLDRYQKPWVL